MSLGNLLPPLISFLGKILHSCSFERVSCVLLSPEHGFPKLLPKYNKKCHFIFFFRFHVSFACIVCVWGRKKEIFFPFEKLFPYQRALLFEDIMKHHRRTAWMQQPTCKWIKSSRTLQANRRGRGPCHSLHSCTIPYPLQLRCLSPLDKKTC